MDNIVDAAKACEAYTWSLSNLWAKSIRLMGMGQAAIMMMVPSTTGGMSKGVRAKIVIAGTIKSRRVHMPYIRLSLRTDNIFVP